MVFEMTDVDDGRLQVQDKGEGWFDDLLAVGCSGEDYTSEMCEDYRPENKKDVGSGLPYHSTKVRMSMSHTVGMAVFMVAVFVFMIILTVGGV
jgi:hypothetical protein